MSNTAIATLRPAAPPPRPSLKRQTTATGHRLRAFLQSMLAEFFCWTTGARPE